jgi:hypothetical protein
MQFNIELVYFWVYVKQYIKIHATSNEHLLNTDFVFCTDMFAVIKSDYGVMHVIKELIYNGFLHTRVLHVLFDPYNNPKGFKRSNSNCYKFYTINTAKLIGINSTNLLGH